VWSSSTPQGIGNIRCIRKRWEDVDLPRDLNSRYVCMMWFAGETSWDEDFRRIISPLFGRDDIQSMPKSDVLFNVLYQMGIYPNIRVFDFEMHHIFGTMDDAVGYFSDRFNARSPELRCSLKEALPQILVERCGHWDLPYRSRNMMFWWSKN
jgi:hypothetical protein